MDKAQVFFKRGYPQGPQQGFVYA